VNPDQLVVVTGAAGFIGNVLVRELRSRGARVRAVVNERTAPLDGLDVEIVRADVREPDSLRAAFEGADLVFHTVAIISLLGDQGGRVPAINVQGAGNAAEAALQAGVRRYIHFSSCHAFDLTDRGKALHEKSPRPGPRHAAYDRSKYAGEMAVRDVFARGLDGVVIHPTGVLGPWDWRPSPVGGVLADLAARRIPMLIGGGFDWVDVRDVVQGTLLAAERGGPGEGYLLSGNWCSIGDLARTVEQVTGVRAPRLTCPMWLARAVSPFADTWARLGGTPAFTSEYLTPLRGAKVQSHAKATEQLGYSPRPLEESIRDVFAWRAEHLEAE
jgi:dihydroflavonol-4-reductase